jgi:hypothetical protein
MKKYIKLLSFLALSVNNLAIATTIQSGKAYVDNNTNGAIFVQYLWRNKGVCSDDKSDKLYKVDFSNSNKDTYDTKSKSGTCDFKVNVYSESQGKNLIAQEYATWNIDDTTKSLKISSYDLIPHYCKPGYLCNTDLINESSHLHVEINKANAIFAVQHAILDQTAGIKVSYSKLSGNCVDTIGNATTQLHLGETVNNSILKRDSDACVYQAKILAADTNHLICTVKASILDSTSNGGWSIKINSIDNSKRCNVNSLRAPTALVRVNYI